MAEPEKIRDFFVGIDSDGCAFDTMELKHKECFIPNFIKYYDLQWCSRYAREASEFVNLYSKSRGINRFPALIEQLDWLSRRPEVQARGREVPRLPSLAQWVESETRLGNPSLQRAVQATGDAELGHALEWSTAVNQAVADMVRGVPPFPHVRECLEKFAAAADVIVVSATPYEALAREWQEHDLERMTRGIYGQESGTKKEILAASAQYAANNRLMVGDAPGDLKAATTNGCLFFPILPGNEDASWRRLHDEGLDHFLNGTFAGEYQDELLRQFDRALPERPPWPYI